MATQVQYRRGTSSENNAFTGALAEITVDTTNNTLRVHDGVVAGGFPLAGINATQTLTNKTLSAATFSGTQTGSANLNLTGTITASGNITGSYLLGNGSQLTGIDATSVQNGTSSVSVISAGGNIRANVAGATVQTLSTGGADVTGYVTASGNVTGGNVVTSGNVSGSYFLGNGSLLTGIDATSIQNGTANVRTISNGNVVISAAGTANVLVVTSTGSNIAGTLNATGNANVGNLGATNVVATNLTGTLTTASQTNITSVGTLGTLSVTGNITGNYILGNGSQLTGIDATSIQNGSSNVRTFNNANVTVSSAGTANVLIITATGANIAGTLNATGNANVGNLGATTVTATNLTGSLTTASQLNVTQVGTLTSLAVVGNISPGGISMSTGNATIGNLYVSGTATIAGNIQQISGNSGQFFGNASTGFNALYAGLPAGFSLVPQSIVNFISSFDGYSQLNLQNTNAGNLSTSDYILTSDEGDDTTHYVDLGIAGSTYDGNYAEGFNALGNILKPGDGYLYVTGDIPQGRVGNLAIGTPDSNSMTTIINGGSSTGNVSAQFFAPNAAATSATTGTFRVKGGIATTSSIYATGNVSGAYFIGNGSQLTGIDATAIQNGTANVRTFLNGNVTTSAAGTANVLVITATGANIAGTLNNGTGNANLGNVGTTNVVATNLTGTLQTASQTAITGVGALNAGSITSGFGSIDIGTDTITVGGIINANANGTGNIGSSSGYFNTVFAKATSAQYADLAEKYNADADYEPGTVVVFGGEKEITASSEYVQSTVAGVISTNPAYIMNAESSGLPVALQGRVPCKVFGNISKGSLLTTSNISGVATVLDKKDWEPGCVIGKSLENYNSTEIGIIEVVVGRL
jgi:hypothetical protein